MSTKPLYQEITSLRRTLADEGRNRPTISQRREAGQTLVEILEQSRTWKRLALEVRSAETRATAQKARQDALSGVWNVVLRSAVNFVLSFISGQKKGVKAKLTLQDVKLPHRVLTSGFPQGIEITQEKKIAPILLEYCLDMLESPVALGVDDVDQEILRTLAHICSKREFVAYFRPDQHMRAIMEEIGKCIGKDGAENCIILEASRVFFNLVKTAERLGIALHFLIRMSLKLIASLYERKLESQDPVQNFLLGAAILLRGNPDLSIGPLSEHGRPILSLARRCFIPNGPHSQWGPLQEYFSAHLLVCQVAGQLQGFMPGDLGDIGNASLTFKHLANLLERFKDSIQFVPHLYARLLAQAQRLDLCEAEWDEVDDHAAMFQEIIQSQLELNDYYRLERHSPPQVATDCSVESLADTPFASFVLRYLYRSGKTSQPSDETSCRWNHALSIASKENPAFTDREVITKLKALCSCAILYPLGTCWTSNSQNNWYTVPGARERLEPSVVLGGSFRDLAAAIETVGGLLVAYGGINASLEHQKWVLTCLTCLTVSTGALDAVDAPDRSSAEKAWQTVWSNIFRADLSYLMLTKLTVDGTVGNLVLRLLVQMVRFCCPGRRGNFDIHNSVWKLPSLSKSPDSPSLPFWLIFVVIKNYGLVETGDDTIGQTMGPEWQKLSSDLGVGRRSKLVGYCLHFLQHTDLKNGSDTAAPACHCLVALMTSSYPSPRAVFRTGFKQRPVACLFLGCCDDFLPHGSFEGVLNSRLPRKRTQEPFERLWGPAHEEVPQYATTIQSDDFTIASSCSVYLKMITAEEEVTDTDLMVGRGGSTYSVTEVLKSGENLFLREHESVSNRLTWLKVHISLLLCAPGEADTMASAMGVVSVVSEAFSSIQLEDASSFCDGIEFLTTLVELNLVARSIVLLAIRTNIDLLETDFAKSASRIYQSCSLMLEQYKLSVEGDEDIIDASSGKAQSADVNLFDDDDDGPTVRGRMPEAGEKTGEKRKISDEKRSRSKRRKSVVPSAYLTSECALLLASLRLALNPNIDDYRVAAEALLGVDDVESPNVDPIGAIDSLTLFSDSDQLAMAPTSLGCRSVPLLGALVAQAMRSAATPHSYLHMLGFEPFASFIEIRATYIGLPPMDESTANSFAALFLSEDRQSRKSLALRPRLRLAQLDAVCRLFFYADASLHDVLDPIFGSKFVLPHLTDLNRFVRRSALNGAATGMLYLDNEEIARSIREKLLPSVGKLSSYKRWYSDFISSKSEEESSIEKEMENRIWLDARDSFHYDVNAICWPIIASQDREVLQQVLFDILWLASKRPESQFLYFQAIDNIAIRAGYGTAERMIDYENQYICHRWVEVNQTLLDLPLVLCAPSVCRKILLAGRRGIDELASVEKLVLSSFMSRSTNNLIPKLVSGSITNSSSRRAIYENELVHEFCSTVYDRFDDSTVTVLLERSFDSIVSHCSVIRLSLESDSRISKSVIVLMRNVFPDFDERIRSSASNICKMTIDSLGNDRAFVDGVKFETILQGLRADTNIVVCGMIELLVFTKFLLFDCSTVPSIKQRWSVLASLIYFGVEKANSSQVFMYTSCLNELVQDPKTLLFREELLDTVLQACRTVLGSSYANSFLTSAQGRDFFGCVFDLHVGAQEEVSSLIQQCRKTRSRVFFGCRKMGTNNQSEPHYEAEACEWSDHLVGLPTLLNAHGGDIPTAAAKTMQLTYDFISVFLEAIDSSGLDLHRYYCFENRTAEHDEVFLSLSTIDPHFAAQNLFTRKVSGRRDHADTMIDLDILCSLSNNTVLLTELRRVERALKNSSAPSSPSLLSFCVDLCSRDYPTRVREAASRCIGEMDVQHVNSCPRESDVFDSISSNNLTQRLHANIMEQLVKSVKNKNPRVAEIAYETIKALALSTTGRECQTFLRGDDVQGLVAELVVSRDCSSLLLALRESELLKINNGDTLGEDWCWLGSLWMINPLRSLSFDLWITHVCAALIACYFKQSIDPTTCPEVLFFGSCQRMCLFDASFAKTVFPALVFGLLTDTRINPPFEDNINTNKVSLDTWVGQSSSALNDHLSSSFASLLSYSLKRGEHRFLSVALDTIDLLRCFTQERFLASQHQKRPGDVAKDHGVYLPFGTVLKLDGKLVAEACLAANRYEQALFYVELFGDVCFGASTILCSEPPINLGSESTTSDISGFGSKGGHFKVRSFAENIGHYFSLLGEAYDGLGEVESKRAIAAMRAESRFTEYETDMALSTQVTHSFYKLELLDNSLSQRRDSPEINLGVMEALEDLQLLTGMRSFVESLQSAKDSVFTDCYDNDLLSEKMSYCHLLEKAWDDCCFPTTSTQNAQRGVSQLNDSSPLSLSIVRPTSNNSSNGFFTLMNDALDSLRDQRYQATSKQLDKIRTACLADFSASGKGYLKLREFSERIHLVNGLQEYSNDPSAHDSLIERFSTRSWMTPLSNCIEEGALRAIMMSHKEEAQFPGLVLALEQHLERVFEANMADSRQKAAHGSLKRLSSVYQYMDASLQDGALERMLTFRLREAQLMEKSGDSNGAIRSSQLAITELSTKIPDLSSGEQAVLVDAYTLRGEWTARYKVEPAASALDNYIKPAVALSKKNDTNANAKRLGRALTAQSVLASSLFEGARSMVNSVDWISAGESLEARKLKLKQDEKRSKGKNSISKQDAVQLRANKVWLQKEIKETSQHRAKFESKMEENRVLAMESLVDALRTGGCDETDSSRHVYRLISMLFSCQEDDKWSKEVNGVSNLACSVPSFRFVPLFSQMISRLEKVRADNKNFQTFLQRLVRKVGLEHPYHCLVPLMALSDNDSQESAKVEKANVAKSILHDIVKDDPEFVGQLISGYTKLAAAYTHLALADVAKFDRDKQSKKISFDPICERQPELRLHRCLGTGTKKLACPPCILTKPPTIQRDANYGNGKEDPSGTERIRSFESYFTVAPSGQSRPRIVVCVGSQGGMYKQLVKGNDDTRQDSVMEQVFEYVNELLGRPVKGKGRKGHQTGRQLKLVTYNVIPLSRKAGVLEFVEHAAAFGDFVKGTGSRPHQVGAHQKYFPHQWRIPKIQAMLKGGEEKGTQRKVFKEVCGNFSPVFRFFFVEKFAHSPEQWFVARNRYTRSVAVSSIVGHILGIGDRHCNNILIQQQTGEVIHIDFGFVFEQGKRLRIPERVPFRLTRNVVDGMGPLGTDGVFTTAAEHTLEVLKQNSNGLLTILSAIASDPLYRWTHHGGEEDTVQPKPKTSKHAPESTQRNAEAALAISRIHEKLKGYEDGTQGEQQSVASQVQLLVNEAKDSDNLCLMFAGWAPYL